MIKEIPKFHETFKPILETLKIDNNISRAKLRERVIKEYYSEIPKELLEQRIKSGDILIHNRLNWGISYLKQAGFITHPKRGFVQLTDKGKKINNDINLQEVKSEIHLLDSFKNFENKTQVDNEIKTETPEDLIHEGFNQIEKDIKNDLLEKLKTIDPYYFEKVILILLKKNGIWRFYRNIKIC